MPEYLTPGVYYERTDAGPPLISALRTDIAGFVGLAPRGPLDTPVPIESWRQFQAHFGGFTGFGFLAYAIKAFFENGGMRCWIVRVASKDPNGGASSSGYDLSTVSSARLWRVAASSPGEWGNDLAITVKETHGAQTITRPRESTPESSAVQSISGFNRFAMVRLSQGLRPKRWKVVSDVDPIRGCLAWVNKKPEMALPYDGPVEGFDPDRPILIESVEYTIQVKDRDHLVAVYDNLSLIPENENHGPKVLAPIIRSGPSDSPGSLPAVPPPITIETLATLPPSALQPLDVSPVEEIPLTGGAEGLATLRAYDFIGEDIYPLDSKTVVRQKRRGIRVLESVDEVSIVAVPDINIYPAPEPRYYRPKRAKPDPCEPPSAPADAVPQELGLKEQPPVFSEQEIYRVQSALIQHCETRKDRVALLDPPRQAARDNESGVSAARAWRSQFDSKFGGFYYPWIRVVDPLQLSGEITRDIPPCGHVAGQFARSDFEVGVHKAPANDSLKWAQDVTVHVNDALQGVLNPLGINAIRTFAGRGLRIFGARTVSSDPDWRYINVRRLMIMIEKAIYVSTQWAVFAPNNIYTWSKLQLSLTGFLATLWQRGALMGESAAAAFFVKCDEENNPPAERDKGRLSVDVGVAPSIPYEFVILRVGRTGNEFEIMEMPLQTGGH